MGSSQSSGRINSQRLGKQNLKINFKGSTIIK